MKTEILYLNGVSKSIEEQKILNDITIRLYEGELTFFVGASGSGKTTLAQIITGILRPDEGYINYYDEQVMLYPQECAQSKGLFYVSANTKLVNRLSIWENIAIARYEWSIGLRYAHRMKRQVIKTCSSCGIVLDLERETETLSFVEILTVECLRAIYRRSRLILFDGVLPVLTEREVRALFSLMGILKKHNISVLFMESDMKYARRYGERIVFLRAGRIVADQEKDCTAWEKSLALLEENTDVSYEEERLYLASLKAAAYYKVLPLRYRTPVGTNTVFLQECTVIGITANTAELYRWYLHDSFQQDALRKINPKLLGITVLNRTNLQRDTFLNLSVEENVMLPGYRFFSRYGVLDFRNIKEFFLKESGECFKLPAKSLRSSLGRFGNRERQIAVLYRSLMQRTKVIVLSGIFDESTAISAADIQRFIQISIKRRKSIVILCKNRELLRKWCKEIIQLPEGEGCSADAFS